MVNQFFYIRNFVKREKNTTNPQVPKYLLYPPPTSHLPPAYAIPHIRLYRISSREIQEKRVGCEGRNLYVVSFIHKYQEVNHLSREGKKKLTTAVV